MRIVFLVVGVVLLVPGLVFFFQGIGVLPGSTMTGDPMWAVIGAIMSVIGGALLARGARSVRSGG